eukprot:535210-Amphidinium_carterae.1
MVKLNISPIASMLKLGAMLAFGQDAATFDFLIGPFVACDSCKRRFPALANLPGYSPNVYALARSSPLAKVYLEASCKNEQTYR